MLYLVDSTLDEVAEVCRLDKLVFSEKWDIPLAEGQAAWLHNQEIYRFIKADDKIVGYHFVAPFPKEIYEQLLSGQIEERSALPFILRYAECKEVYLYVYSIVVDITLEHAKQYSKLLVHDLVETIARLKARRIEVKDFGFIAITEAGIRLAQRLGLTFIEEFESDEKPNPQVYRSDLKHLKSNSLFLQNEYSK
jgi:phosphoglycolate phosphatase-like HAD superfamily hydrolase